MIKRKSAVVAGALTLIGGITAVAQRLQPSPEQKKLAVFVGTWKDEAEIKPGLLGPGGKMSITQTCEWFTGGFSLVCHAEASGSMGESKSLTVLNYDAEQRVYTYFELNSIGLGNSATGTVEGDTWTFTGEGKRGGKPIKTRFTIKVPSPNSALLKAEMSADGGPWTVVMELKGSRVKPS